MDNLSLRVRLVLLIVLMAIFSSVLIAARTLQLSSDHISQDQARLLQSTSTRMAHRLQEDLQARAREITLLTQLPLFRDPQAATDGKQQLLAHLKSIYRYYAWIGLTDAEGNITVDSDKLLAGKNVATRDWFINGSQKLTFDDVHDAILLAQLLPRPTKDNTPLRLVDISAPLHTRTGELIGVIGAHLSIEWASEVRAQMLEEANDPSLEIMVLNHEGKLVLDSDNPQAHSAGFASFVAEFMFNPAMATAPQSLTWPGGNEYLTAVAKSGAAADSPSLGWAVVVRKPSAVAYLPARELAFEIVLLCILVCLMFIAVIWVVIRRSLKPLELIAKTADRIKNQELDTPIPLLKGSNEVATFARSLTELVNSLRAKNKELLLAERMLSENRLGIMITDQYQCIIRVNQAFTHYTGYTEAEVIGRKPSYLSSGRHPRQFYEDMNKQLALYGSWRGEIWNRNKNGQDFPEFLTITTLKDAQGMVHNYIGMFEDISEKKGAELQLERLANYDILTSLPNRTSAIKAIDAAITIKKAEPGKFALIFIDLVQFKNINDTLGHASGDDLLRQVAQRLNSLVDEPSFLARWGGDEFLIYAEGCDSFDAAELAQKLVAAMSKPYQVDNNSFHIGMNSGISLFPDDARDAASLLRFADVAMVKAKKLKGQPYCFYDNSMNESVIQHMELDASLHRANENGFSNFELYYQPQYASDTGELKGTEALIRWKHPIRGFVRPDIFIPIAETNGLISPMGDWILEQACLGLKQINQTTQKTLSMSINISGVQLQSPDFVQKLCATVDRHLLERSQLIVEVTETAFTEDRSQANHSLQLIREAGFGVSIDDFGTGYASLDYILRFKPSEIKVDRVFIDKMLIDEHCLNIVKFTLGLAVSLHMEVVAEGVETAEQLQRLQELGAPIVQGYLLGKPQPLAQLLITLTQSPATKATGVNSQPSLQ